MVMVTDSESGTTADGRAASVVRSVTSRLQMFYQFHALVLLLRGKTYKGPPTVVLPGEQNTLVIWEGSEVVDVVTPDQVNLASWDNTRYCTLSRRLANNWDIFNSLWADEPALSAVERAQTIARFERVREELCVDVDEMLRMCRETLGPEFAGSYTVAFEDICRG